MVTDRLPRKRFITGELVLRTKRTGDGLVHVRLMDSPGSTTPARWITITEEAYQARLDPVFASDAERERGGN